MAADPEPKQVADFEDNITGFSGIVPLGGGHVAVCGGPHTSFAFERGSMHVFIVSLDK